MKNDYYSLADLKREIDTIIEIYDINLETIPVLITLAEPSVGSKASEKVKSANLGIDWERGQFRIEPVKSLVRLGNSLHDVKPPLCRSYDGRIHYWCAKCNYRVNKNDYYCRTCGQKLR